MGAEDGEAEDWLTLGVAATLSQQYTSDQRGFLESLAGMLHRCLPDHTEVERKGLLPVGNRPVRELRVTLGDHCYLIHDSGRGALAARRRLIKRGIALHTEDLAMEEWIRDLCAALEVHARHNHSAAEALRRLAG